MTLFSYDRVQRDSILASLPGVVCFGTEEATGDEVVAALEACACRYITRRRMNTVAGVQKRLEALELVLCLFNESADDIHRERVSREIREWKLELSLIEHRRDHRARLKFMIDAFEIFARAEEAFSPLVETIALSDSDSPARNFFEAAIVPVCFAAREPLRIRAAINAINVFKLEMQSAEIDLIRGK